MNKVLIRHGKTITTLSMLGFLSGLPFLLISSTLQAWYSSVGNNLIMLGSLSLVSMPYALKFFWAPVLDFYNFSQTSGRRFWLLISQFIIALCLITLANMSPANSPKLMLLVAFVMAFWSATFDIAADAYRQVVTPKTLRSVIVGFNTTFFRVGMLLSGGFALVLADNFGWSITYMLMSLLVLSGFLVTWSIASPVAISTPVVSWQGMFTLPVAALGKHKDIKKILLFILLYKVGDAFLLSLVQPFFLQKLHFSLSHVGYLVKVFGLLATFLGTILASFYINRVNLYNALIFFGILQSASLLLFLLLLHTHLNFIANSAVFLESFASGASSCALVVLFMNLCDDKYAATQLSFLTAVSSLPRIFLGPMAGYIASTLGWDNFFVISFAMSLPCLLVLLLQLRKSNSLLIAYS